MQETWLQPLGQEDPLVKRMATHSCILPWKIPWIEEPGGLESIGLQLTHSDTTDQLTHTHTHGFLVKLEFQLLTLTFKPLLHLTPPISQM